MLQAREQRRPGAMLQAIGRVFASVTTALVLASCSGAGNDAAALGSRMWGTFTVAVESRPAPPRPGSNEIVIQLTGEHARPVYDALVYVRTAPTQDWIQAIEDGHVGVYRRAVRFAPVGDANLEVLLRHNGEETTFVFPVKFGAPS